MAASRNLPDVGFLRGNLCQFRVDPSFLVPGVWEPTQNIFPERPTSKH